MRRLSTYLETPFDDRDISLNELAAYTTDHLQRMIANNPGNALDARIAATTTAMAALDDAFSGDQATLGLRKARKLAKDNFRANLPREAGKIVAAVIAVYGDGAPEVLEVVPQGRVVFSSARDDELENHLDTVVTGVTAHQADLGAPLVAQATALRDNWLVLYAASETSTGTKTATEAEKRAARGVLQWELYVNLQEISRLFPRQPDQASLYMRQDLLGFPVSGSGGGGPSGGGLPSPSTSEEEETSSLSSEEEESSTSSEPPSSSSSSFPPSSSSSEPSSSSSSEPPSSSSSEPPSSSSSEPPSSSSSEP